MTATEPSRGTRQAGIDKMVEVYGFAVDPEQIPGDFVDETVDHLFAQVWGDGALNIRDRRLLTIGVLAGLGQPKLLEIQFSSALSKNELTIDQARKLVVHLAHYVGWPLATSVNEALETVIARQVAQEDSAGGSDQ